jgi:hypothetical protein
VDSLTPKTRAGGQAALDLCCQNATSLGKNSDSNQKEARGYGHETALAKPCRISLTSEMLTAMLDISDKLIGLF